MPSKTLDQLSGVGQLQAPTPYPTEVIKVKVIKVGHKVNYTTSSGDAIQILNFAIADETTAMLASLNDVSKHGYIVENSNLHIRNFMVKNNRVVMTAKTKIFQGQEVTVPNNIRESGVLLVIPNSPTKTIKDASRSPDKTILTVQGQIVKDEAVKTVKVNGVDTPIRIIRIKDEDTMDVTLWRDLAHTDKIKMNEYIEITQCMKGEYQSKPSLSSTRNTTIKEIKPPVKTVRGTIEGVTVSEEHVEISVQNMDEYMDFVLRAQMFKDAFHIEGEDAGNLENFLVNLLPIAVELAIEGSNVMNMSLI